LQSMGYKRLQPSFGAAQPRVSSEIAGSKSAEGW
jgi:hypothetical protein